MSQTNQVLDDVWQSGYCDATVQNVAETADREKRVEWLKAHVGNCLQCATAAKVKDLEARVAAAMGCSALFDAGGNITKLPGFSDAFAVEVRKAMRSGLIDHQTLLWMGRVAAERAGKPWPGRVA